MKVSYQRELYRSRMRCELAGEESGCGYPLQMCLRNSIPGLLPCSAEPADGRIFICWDITSRNSLKELGGGFTLELLERVLRAVYAVMRELDGYLVSSGYLVLLPEQIYLDASRKKVGFVCDYEDETSFQTGIEKLSEYILAEIDHKDPEQMRLGYGLYRLAVQENFSREEFQRLLFGRGSWTESPDFRKPGPEQNTGGAEDLSPEGYGFSDEAREETKAGDAQRQKILDSFFQDDEEEMQAGRGYLPVYGLLAGGAIGGLEMFFYLRNGRHIHPGWLVFGFLIMIACMGAAGIGYYIKNRKREATEKQREGRCTSGQKTIGNGGGQRPTGSGETTDQGVMPYREDIPYGAVETMVLQSPGLCGEGEIRAVLEPVDPRGGQFTLPEKGAVLGKLSEAADIVLPSPAVSRIHARIIRQGEDYFVQDLNSRNGTCVNGNPLASQQLTRLREQDEISFADLSYRFCIEKGIGP